MMLYTTKTNLQLVADVKANFILYDRVNESIIYDQHHDIMSRINQPKDCTVFNQTAIIFKAPKWVLPTMTGTALTEFL